MKYVLGVDGGGTKTYVCIMSASGKILGEGSAGPSNYHDLGVEVTKANLADAIAMASKQAGIVLPEFAAAFLGMAGVVSGKDRSVIQSIAADLDLPSGDSLGIDHDCRIALAGGLSGRPGIVQIAGTGASTYGRSADGKEWRSGGWAHLLADEGGSYWYGLKAMKAAVRVEDGRSAGSVLRQLVIDRLQLGSMNDIMHRLYVTGMSRSEIASLCPLLINAAREGDDVALAIVDQGTAELAACIEAVANRLGFAQENTDCEIALVGGLFSAGDIVVRPLRDAVHRRLPHSSIVFAEMQPVLGACFLALDCLGISAEKYLVTELSTWSTSRSRRIQTV